MPYVLLQGFIITAHASGDMPDGSILHFDRNLLINIGIQWLNIAVLTFFLIFILYKPVKNFLIARQQRIKSEIEAAQLELGEAMDLKEKYEKMILNVQNEREEILRLAHKKAMEKSDQLMFDARREAGVLRERVLAELELERKNMMNEMREQMIEISTLMAGRFIEVSIDRETQDKYIDEAFAEWEEAYVKVNQPVGERPAGICAGTGLGKIYRQALTLAGNNNIRIEQAPQELQAFIKFIPGSREDITMVLYAFLDIVRREMDSLQAEVVSAVPLTDVQLEKVEKKLINMFHRHLDITVKVDPSLLGGLRVIVGDNILDDSIKRKLADMKSSIYKGVYAKQWN